MAAREPGNQVPGACTRVHQVHGGEASRAIARLHRGGRGARRATGAGLMTRHPRLHAFAAAAAAAAAITSAAGCGGKELSLTATAKVEGNFVVVTASCNIRSQVEASGVSGPCAPDAPAMLRVPAERIGTGAKSVAVVLTGAGKRAQVDVAVDIPASATGPYFLVAKCVGDGGEFLGLEDGGRKFDCHTAGGARITLSMQASPGAKLTIGGKTVGVPEGPFELGVDLGDGILALSIDDLLSDASDGPKLAIPWKLDAAGKQIEGKLTAFVKFGQHDTVMWQWLHDVAAGKVDRPAFQPRAEGRKTAVRVPTEKFAKLTATDCRGTVRELGLIAVEREVKRTKGGTCEFESKGKVITAARFGVELEVKVIGTADGKEVTTKIFPAPTGCPSFAMLRPDRAEVAVRASEADVMAWLDTLTEPGAMPEAAAAPAATPAK